MDDQVKVRIQSVFGDGVLLLGYLNGEEALSGGFVFQISVFSTKHDLVLSKILGTEMTIEFDLPRGGIRYFHGYVTSFGLTSTSIQHARYFLTFRSWLWMLNLNTDCRIFQQAGQSIPDIVKSVCKDSGFTDIKEFYERGNRIWDYCVQYRESDYNFVNRLLEQEGIYTFFEHASGKSKLILTDGIRAHKPVAKYEKIRLVPHGENGKKQEEFISDWAVARSVKTASFSNKDFDFTKPKANLLVKKSGTLEQQYSKTESYDYPGEYLEYAEGEAVARNRLENSDAGYEVVEASGNVLGLGAGNIFQLEEHPRKDQNAEYLIIAATYEIHGESPETGGRDSGRVKIGYRLIQSSRAYRPGRTTQKPRVDGPQTATVIGINEENISTDPYGRVKVKFHWDRVETSNEKSSCWIRVAQMWAGARFGGVNIPRNGEEVIVEFLEGDPDRPIITGRVYNADNMPPYDLPANKTQTGIKTRSTKDGKQDTCTPDNFNEIRFEDKKDKEELHMQAERDMSTLVKRNQSLSVGVNRDISVGGDETTSITKIRRLHVTEDEFINIDGNHTNIVCKDVVETFMQNQDIDITQDKTEHVKQVYTLTTDQKFSLNQGATNLTFEGTNVTLDAAGTVLVKRGPAELLMDGAGKIKLSTPASITLECGPSKIEMTPAGIKLTSVQVIAEATPSKLELGPVAASLTGAMVKVEAQTICSVMGMATLKLNTP